ncbi:MAG: Ig-like domain-containing protein [Paludibacteraceae bacterium]|nr:Ig-like domain-containing protein [Paludibacteraceae bacterium]
MKKSVIIFLGIMLVALVGCKKNENTWGKLEQSNVTIKIGETIQIKLNHDGNTHQRWTSADETIATVDETGMVTGVRVGKTVVTVNGLECVVTVVDDLMALLVEPLQNWEKTLSDVKQWQSQNIGMTLDTVAETSSKEVIEKIDTVRDPGTQEIIRYDTTTTWVDYISSYTFKYAEMTAVVKEYTYKFNENENLFMSAMKTDADNFANVQQYIKNRYVAKTGAKYQYVNNGIYIYIPGKKYTKDNMNTENCVIFSNDPSLEFSEGKDN